MSEITGIESVYCSLKDVSLDIIDHFKDDKSSSAKRILSSYMKINECIEPIILILTEMSKTLHLYDFCDDTPGNGYRSFVKAVGIIGSKTLSLSETIFNYRSSYFFRRSYYSREVEAYAQIIAALLRMLQHCQTLISWSDNGQLFPITDHKPIELLKDDTSFVNQYAFYGRCLGFQFCPAMRTIFKALSILMASFSEFYYSGGKVIEFLYSGSKYLLYPEVRAKRIVNISQYASVDFCKAFWFLGEMELMQRLPSISSSTLAVNKVIMIQTDPLEVASVRDGSPVTIPVPSSHKDPEPIPIRLLSASYYNGMDDVPKKQGVKETSPSIVFHCHGGGFVAQSSRSHETYLRQWCMGISAPIVSIDYSLAPEAPYPRALEEVFYAYCWVLKNCLSLGTTAQRIILAGDSAGANLNLGLTLKCLQLGIRPPDGLFLAYAPVVLNFVPSPSRLLCLMDPLLPFGFLMSCSKAYACCPEDYMHCKEQERKLERSIDVKTCSFDDETCSPSQPATSSEPTSPDEISENPDDVATPLLMDKKSSKPIYDFLSALMSAFSNKIFKSCDEDDTEKIQSAKLDEEMAKEAYLPCPVHMLDIDIPHDPLISPYYAPDEVLNQFPPISLLTVHFDPFLDDCVEFAKRLRSLGNQVTLDILDGLSHGFLNFSLLCKEASEGSKVCIERINGLLVDEKGVQA